MDRFATTELSLLGERQPSLHPVALAAQSDTFHDVSRDGRMTEELPQWQAKCTDHERHWRIQHELASSSSERKVVEFKKVERETGLWLSGSEVRITQGHQYTQHASTKFTAFIYNESNSMSYTI